MFELICNILLFVGLVYTYQFHVLEAPVPAKVLRNPYALNPDVWPNVIIIILLVLVVINIVRIFMKNKGKPEFSLGQFFAAAGKFFTSRLFLGIVLVVATCFILEPLGFMGTCFLMLFFYGILLGDRKFVRLFILSILITLILYVMFSVLLSVNLPRGTIPEARNFALYIESLVSVTKSAI